MRVESGCFRKAKELDCSEMTDGYVIYDDANDRVHFLNPTAAIVFELCDGAHTAAQISRYIADAFRLAEPPQPSVEDCLSSLRAEGLIEPCGTS